MSRLPPARIQKKKGTGSAHPALPSLRLCAFAGMTVWNLCLTSFTRRVKGYLSATRCFAGPFCLEPGSAAVSRIMAPSGCKRCHPCRRALTYSAISAGTDTAKVQCIMRTGKSQIFGSVALIVVRIFREHIRIWHAGRPRTSLPALPPASAGAAESTPKRALIYWFVNLWPCTKGVIYARQQNGLIHSSFRPQSIRQNYGNTHPHLVAAIKSVLTFYKTSRYIAIYL
jgi:hypothetical protein